MQLDRAQAIVNHVVANAPGPVSVFVADTHGELVAAAAMDGAAHDTRLNAQRKAYTAARSDARSTRELAEKVRDDPVERASFDPFFTFFLGGVAVFDGETRLGAVGVSGLPGDIDEPLRLRAIEATARPNPGSCDEPGSRASDLHPPTVCRRGVQRLERAGLADGVGAPEQELRLAACGRAHVLHLEPVGVLAFDLDPLDAVGTSHLDHRRVAVPGVVEEER